MVKKRGPSGPPKAKRGRPKGSGNKRFIVTTATPHKLEVGDIVTFGDEINKPSSLDMKSRLDECMTRLENAVAEAISKLKEII